MQNVEIIVTADGSNSILNTSLNETYHSRHGALQESVHVFIQNGLEYFIRHNKPGEIKILEVGFGTGLNALLTLEYAVNHNCQIHYTTLEAHPLDATVWKQLNYSRNSVDLQTYFNNLHDARWEVDEKILPNFILNKKHILIQEAALPQNYFNVTYFDAFAPSKQPEMWEQGVLKKVIETMVSGAVFVTYCAKGQLKRDLRSLDLNVETIPGPPGKKEMVRATKQE